MVRTIRRRGSVRDAVAAIRRANDAAIVVVYHRIANRERPRYEIVPTVPRDLFRRQIEAFADLGRIVPLRSVLEERADDGPRFALTFDDDLGSHVGEVLPILQDVGVHGTFFLSGRSLHGLAGYWFERLEALVRERGIRSSASMLGVPADTEPELARACEADPRAREIIDGLAPPVAPTLDAAGMRALASAGMDIGFHTLHHPVLTSLDDEALRTSLTKGRQELESVAGQSLTWFAYPHGKADTRTASAVGGAGFTDAWTTEPHVAAPDDDPYLRGRWDPLPVSTDHMVLRLARLVATTGAAP
jgi:peptidoglycan/xylan/chitin deacetylase (PgdA/CDA1 family)